MADNEQGVLELESGEAFDKNQNYYKKWRHEKSNANNLRAKLKGTEERHAELAEKIGSKAIDSIEMLNEQRKKALEGRYNVCEAYLELYDDHNDLKRHLENSDKSTHSSSKYRRPNNSEDEVQITDSSPSSSTSAEQSVPKSAEAREKLIHDLRFKNENLMSRQNASYNRRTLLQDSNKKLEAEVSSIKADTQALARYAKDQQDYIEALEDKLLLDDLPARPGTLWTSEVVSQAIVRYTE